MDDIIGEALRESCGIDILDLIQTPQLDSSINIILDPLYRHFRTAKEIESDGHGNYINGKIELNPPPRPGETVRLELSLVPAEDAQQSRHMIHPNLLIITIKEQNRITYRGGLSTFQSWKLTLFLKDGDVLYQDHLTKNLTKVDSLIDGNKLYLGSSSETGKDHILINIVTPLQRKVDTGAITVNDVVKDRILNDHDRPNLDEADLSHKTVSKEYTSGSSKIELHRCRLRICQYQDHSRVADAFSETINDTKDKNFGAFNIGCMSEPHGACEKGGWNHFLVSRSKVATSGFYPIFVFACSPMDPKPERVDKLFQNFKQISCKKEDLEVMHHSIFKFKIPSQQRNVIQAIKQYRLNTYITLYREADDQYASDMVRFDYHDIHDVNTDDDEECHYCQIKKNMPIREVRKENTRKRLCRRRYDSNMTTTSGISDVGSPASTVSTQQLEEGTLAILPRFSAEDILQNIGGTTPQPMIDLGLDEFIPDYDPNLVREGIPENDCVADMSSDGSSESSFSEDWESSDEEDVLDLCLNTKKLRV